MVYHGPPEPLWEWQRRPRRHRGPRARRQDRPPVPPEVRRAGSAVALLGLGLTLCAGVVFATLLVLVVFDADGGHAYDGVALRVFAMGATGVVQIVLGVPLARGVAGVRGVLAGFSAAGVVVVGWSVVETMFLVPIASAYGATIELALLFAAAAHVGTAVVVLGRGVGDHARAVRQVRRTARAARELVRPEG